jgi:hypothetical protein
MEKNRMIDSLLEKYFDCDHPLWHKFQNTNVNIDTVFVWEPGASGNFIQAIVTHPPTDLYHAGLNEYKWISGVRSRRFGPGGPKWGGAHWLRLDWLNREKFEAEIQHEYHAMQASGRSGGQLIPNMGLFTTPELTAQRANIDAPFKYVHSLYPPKLNCYTWYTDIPRIPIMLGKPEAIDRFYSSAEQVFIKEKDMFSADCQYGATHDLPFIFDNVCNFNCNNMVYIISNTSTAWITNWLCFIKCDMNGDVFGDPTKVKRMFSLIAGVKDGRLSENFFMIDNFMKQKGKWFRENRPLDYIEQNSTIYFEMLVHAINTGKLDADRARNFVKIRLEHKDLYGIVNYDFHNDYTLYCQEYFNNKIKNFIAINYEDLFFKLDLSKISFLNLDKNKIREYSLKNIELLKPAAELTESIDKMQQLLDYEKFLRGH